MRVATVERFAEPSRRCDPTLIAGPDDEVVVWELDRGSPVAIPSRLEVARALPSWVTPPFSPTRRWRLLVACLHQHGSRRSHLVNASELIRQRRAHDVDEVVCFSKKGFAFAQAFADETARPCREFLSSGTQYFGEFAFELSVVIPYAYWLHEQGKLEVTVSSPDTRCLYYFSPNHVERAVERRYVPITEYPAGEPDPSRFDGHQVPVALDTTRWSPPPYRSVYRDDRFRWPKPPLVVCNKASAEAYLQGGFAVNHLDIDLLLEVVGALRSRYTIIYNRPQATDIINDDSEIREVGDIEAVQSAYPDVVTIQDLHSHHPDLTYNELQLRLFAGCEHFVSVLGGGSYLASYFGGTNVVYAQRGQEVDSGAFDGWFDRLSGARVVPAGTPDDLVRTVRREFLEATA